MPGWDPVDLERLVAPRGVGELTTIGKVGVWIHLQLNTGLRPPPQNPGSGENLVQEVVEEVELKVEGKEEMEQSILLMVDVEPLEVTDDGLKGGEEVGQGHGHGDGDGGEEQVGQRLDDDQVEGELGDHLSVDVDTNSPVGEVLVDNLIADGPGGEEVEVDIPCGGEVMGHGQGQGDVDGRGELVDNLLVGKDDGNGDMDD